MTELTRHSQSRFPDFIVIGATRSGTTSLQHYLGQHPQLFLCPSNEPNYFLFDGDLPSSQRARVRRAQRIMATWVRDRTAFQRLYADAESGQLCGEVSPRYLDSPQSAELIHQAIPEARLIVTLRHPVERAYARFLARRSEGQERRADFAAVLHRELEKHQAGGVPGSRDVQQAAFQYILGGGDYLDCSVYCDGLGRYLNRFSRDRIHIGIFDDFQGQPDEYLRNIFRFLEVDPQFECDSSVRHNPTGEIQNPVVRALWQRSSGMRARLRPYLPSRYRDLALPLVTRSLMKPALDPELYSLVSVALGDEIDQLEQMIDVDLQRWRR